jgi:predicted ATPase
LGKEEAEELLTFLLGSDTSLKALKQLILEKTEGTPFFMEEAVQTLVEEQVLVGERGNYRLQKAPTELHISPTVQGILAARIDRLATAEKELLHQLAVIGREFPLSLVRQVVTQPEEELYRLLSSLQSKEFLYEQPAFPEVEYIFKHALTQEVAYGTVLQERRKALHERTAKAIEELYGANLAAHYSGLAYHYSRSGNTQKAVEYLQLAGQQAVQRSADAEAVNHLTTALELLKTLPNTPERTLQELTLQLALGAPLMVTKGYAVPEVERLYARARELCQQLSESPQLFPALWGLWVFYVLRPEYKMARELGEQLLHLAQNVQDPALFVEAHFALGETLFLLGEFGSARAHLEQSHVFYNPEQHRSLAFLAGFDSGIISLSWAAWALWMLGYPDQALKSNHEALTLAQEFSHPPSLAFALTMAANLHQFRQEGHAAQERAEAAVALCAERGIPFFLALGTTLRGWALIEHEQIEEGITQIRQGMAAWQEMGAETSRSRWLALLAEAYRKGGQTEEGLIALTEALAVVDKTGERYYEAELYRLKGELTLAQSSVQGLASSVQKEAEECFLRAIEIARRQSAKSLELRAVMSLARLWQQQGKREEARQMLTEIYGWFTEGFDTADLKEAKALLEALP